MAMLSSVLFLNVLVCLNFVLYVLLWFCCCRCDQLMGDSGGEAEAWAMAGE